jgi:hypothetical protein
MHMQHASRRNLLLALGAAALGAGLAPAAARASMILAMDLGELTQRAERIVVGEVTAVRSAWDDQHKRILTTVELKVAEAWKGQMPGDGKITIVQPGGVADGIEMRVHGMPSFTAGERAVLFLRGAVAQPQSVVGMGQGKRGLSFDPASKRWMVDGGDRSAAVNIDLQGRPQAARPEAPLPLDEMRRRVSTMVKAR